MGVRRGCVRFIAAGVLAVIAACAPEREPAPFATKVMGAALSQKPPREASRPSQIGGESVVQREPRFKVEAVRWAASPATNEADPWPWSSDEVFAIFYEPEHRTVSSTFGNVDTGDSRPFASDQRCIWPVADRDRERNGSWSCIEGGGPAPVRFAVSLHEIDFNWDFGFCVHATSPNDLQPPDYWNVCDWGNAQTLVAALYKLTAADIIPLLDPSCRCVEFDVTGDSGPPRVPVDAVIGRNGGDYHLTVRITRLADAIVEPPIAPN